MVYKYLVISPVFLNKFIHLGTSLNPRKHLPVVVDVAYLCSKFICGDRVMGIDLDGATGVIFPSQHQHLAHNHEISAELELIGKHQKNSCFYPAELGTLRILKKSIEHANTRFNWRTVIYWLADGFVSIRLVI